MSAFRHARRLALSALVLAGIVNPAAAQTYPSQNINVIVAFAAGGIADVVGRLIGIKLGDRLGRTVVVENRGGAGGNLPARPVAAAAPPGYTLLPRPPRPRSTTPPRATRAMQPRICVRSPSSPSARM